MQSMKVHLMNLSSLQKKHLNSLIKRGLVKTINKVVERMQLGGFNH